MTTDFKASQVQTHKIIVTGTFAGDDSNQLLIYNKSAEDSGSPNQGVIDTAKFDTTSGIGSDVFLFISGGISTKGTAGSYGVSAIGGDLHVSGNLTVGGSYPAGGGSSEQYWFTTDGVTRSSNRILTTGSVEITGSLTLGKTSVASGQYAMAFGDTAGALGNGSLAHGQVAVVEPNGKYGHAEGRYTTVKQQAGHAEGYYTTAAQQNSHAEGMYCLADGLASHVEGFHTTASAKYSHASGYYCETFVDADSSYVTGIRTIASGSGQTVVGFFNKRNNNFSLFVVGDGIADDDTNRSDILRINPGVNPGEGRAEVTGTLVATQGLSGSLTQLSIGSSYLIAGSGVTITSQSNGSVTISSTASEVEWINVPLGHSDSTLSTNTNYIGQFYSKASTAIAPVSEANPYVWRSHVTGSIRKVSVSSIAAGAADKALVQIVNMTTSQTKTIDSQYDPIGGDGNTNNVVYVLTSSLEISPNDGVYITYRANSGSQTIASIYNLLVQVSGTNWP